ncbi:uncharacterized protein LOC129756280 isoform X2 [Uranotaenia lowii]|nr:uncharacterized protein LOC129756280 isoform X2 [Uranotaenia lowii]
MTATNSSKCSTLPVVGSRRLVDLSQEERQSFLASFDYVLTDCDGVIWSLQGEIEGVGAAISLLKSYGKSVFYVSNNSVRSLDNYKKQILRLGQEPDLRDLNNPATSVIKYLKSINFTGLIYAIVPEEFLKLLREAGYEVLTGPAEPMSESFHVILPATRDKQPVKAVIIDSDVNVNNLKLMRAEAYLKRDPDCLFLAGATDYEIAVGNAFTFIGPGYYVEILERATSRKATVLGKPSLELGKLLTDRYGIKDPRRVLFVGDMLSQDIAFGRVAGFQTLLVLTGGTSMDQLLALKEGDHIPDFYTDGFADLGKLGVQNTRVSNL